MIEITRRAYFSASHRLHSPQLPDDQNCELYGCCNALHGHNYWVDVTLRGEVDPRTGMVMNLDHLNALIQREIISQVDHRNLNDVPMLKGRITTAETLAVQFWNALAPHLAEGLLCEVRVYETPENSAAYRGE
ncbi:6-carboxytetrahydropterin synthase [Candidatus Sumerlaeota bacterium]|nr:6-carboxytetrahydropterin synthase [Candidatus Sumerlaeota bacterium]